MEVFFVLKGDLLAHLAVVDQSVQLLGLLFYLVREVQILADLLVELVVQMPDVFYLREHWEIKHNITLNPSLLLRPA